MALLSNNKNMNLRSQFYKWRSTTAFLGLSLCLRFVSDACRANFMESPQVSQYCQYLTITFRHQENMQEVIVTRNIVSNRFYTFYVVYYYYYIFTFNLQYVFIFTLTVLELDVRTPMLGLNKLCLKLLMLINVIIRVRK